MTYLTQLPGAKQVPSPYNSSRNNAGPEALVLHIMDGTLAGCDSWFLNNPYQVSAHLGTDLNGTEVHQYVGFDRAAHANGAIEGDGWNLKLIRENNYSNPNTWSISLEMQGTGPAEPTPSQFEKAAQIAAWLFRNVFFKSGATGVAIDRDHILKHSDVSPQSRVNCPGWSEYTMARFIARVKAIHDAPAVDPRIIQARDLLAAVAEGR